MKRLLYLVSIVILVVLVSLLIWEQSRKTAIPLANAGEEATQEKAETRVAPNTPIPEPQIQRQTTNPKASVNNSPPISEAVMEYARKSTADSGYDWRQPINFYGKVVDENGQPVNGASIHFRWTDISETGTSDADATSDGNGMFSLTDRRGKRMSVTASKQGYYSAADARLASFEYANPADGLFTPDPNNPVVFHLRKKGAGVDLITSQYGMAPDFEIKMPRDGSLVKIDLLQRKAGDSGQMTMSQVKPEYKNWKGATSWSFGIEISDGGFVVENEEFPFQAPESGYQPVIEFNFQQGQTNWTENLTKDYYVKFGNPPRYGRLHLETGIMWGGARLTYAINPDGSRNLEPK